MPTKRDRAWRRAQRARVLRARSERFPEVHEVRTTYVVVYRLHTPAGRPLPHTYRVTESLSGEALRNGLEFPCRYHPDEIVCEATDYGCRPYWHNSIPGCVWKKERTYEFERGYQAGKLDKARHPAPRYHSWCQDKRWKMMGRHASKVYRGQKLGFRYPRGYDRREIEAESELLADPVPEVLPVGTDI